MCSMLPSVFGGSPSIKVNVLVYYEDGEWVAHCLQMDLVATADDRETAEEDIIDLIRAHVAFALENDNLGYIFKPAPAEDWERLSRFHECEVRVVSLPAPEGRSDHTIPVNEVELCFA